MAGAKKSTWIAGAAAVAVAILVATWFLAVSPKIDSVRATNAQTESTREKNRSLEAQVAKLRDDFKKLPDYKAQIDALRLQIPTTAQLADYLRQVDGIAAETKVTVTSVSAQPPQAVIPSAAGAGGSVSTEVPAPSASATPAPSSAPSATPTPAASTPAASAPAASGSGSAAAAATSTAPPGFVALPLKIVVVGTWDGTTSFIDRLQNGTQRLFLAATVAGVSQEKSPAEKGRPATAEGDQELTVTGFAYVLTPATSTPAATPSPTATPALPAAVPGKNPLVPYGGK